MPKDDKSKKPEAKKKIKEELPKKQVASELSSSKDHLPPPQSAAVMLRKFANPKAGKSKALHINRTDEPLFPHSPCPNDIKQGFVGDCFLLSAISSILTKKNGSKIIQNMMREDNGKVAVRLFDKKGMAHYIEVDKTVRFFKHADGPLWVSILEKAYTSFAMKEDYNLLDQGGGACFAFEILLGQPGSYQNINLALSLVPTSRLFKVKSPALIDSLSKNLDLSEEERNTQIKKAKNKDITDLSTLQSLDPYNPTLYVNLTLDEASTWLELLIKYPDIKKRWDHLYLQKEFRVVTRLEDFKKLFENISSLTPDEQEIISKITKWLANFLPGKRGTGQYSQEQLALYKKISQQLDDGDYLAAGTGDAVTSPTKIQLFSWKKTFNGEPVAKGLAGPHSYAVVKCHERNGLKGIVLRNPWGIRGRGYIEKPISNKTDEKAVQKTVLSAIEINEPEFWMELSDFTKRFVRIYCTGSINRYLELSKETAIGKMVTNTPCYILAGDGLYYKGNKVWTGTSNKSYYAGKTTPITLIDRIIDKQHDIEKLWATLGSKSKIPHDEKIRKIETEELEIIASLEASYFAQSIRAIPNDNQVIRKEEKIISQTTVEPPLITKPVSSQMSQLISSARNPLASSEELTQKPREQKTQESEEEQLEQDSSSIINSLGYKV